MLHVNPKNFVGITSTQAIFCPSFVSLGSLGTEKERKRKYSRPPFVCMGQSDHSLKALTRWSQSQAFAPDIRQTQSLQIPNYSPLELYLAEWQRKRHAIWPFDLYICKGCSLVPECTTDMGPAALESPSKALLHILEWLLLDIVLQKNPYLQNLGQQLWRG